MRSLFGQFHVNKHFNSLVIVTIQYTYDKLIKPQVQIFVKTLFYLDNPDFVTNDERLVNTALQMFNEQVFKSITKTFAVLFDSPSITFWAHFSIYWDQEWFHRGGGVTRRRGCYPPQNRGGGVTLPKTVRLDARPHDIIQIPHQDNILLYYIIL